MSFRHANALVLCAALAGGCGKKATTGVRLEQVSAAFQSAGFKLDNFQRIDGARYAAQTCATGPIGGIDTLVCEYPAAEAAGQGYKAAERWIGDSVTGSVLMSGRTLLAVADRGHADPNGKVIHKITAAYRALK